MMEADVYVHDGLVPLLVIFTAEEKPACSEPPAGGAQVVLH